MGLMVFLNMEKGYCHPKIAVNVLVLFSPKEILKYAKGVLPIAICSMFLLN